ncbi:hypothetical protein RHSIM_Rhsim02G0144900 [Rhododendron simsii]|uniref:Aminotransferase-like plant mobile domain-containing protein n=1 Tax=Rhododendron simsii TaxID=118357 RepID=A0A834HML8_RHOSS|nr:hypothetical protein RHSIM_Rhsim02G0144900 [Rhododendron simsii]
MRLSTRESVVLDPSSLSSADVRLVERLRKAYTEVGKHGSRFDQEGRVRATLKSSKTSWGCWLRYFFKDLPPPGTTLPVGQASEFYGKMYNSDLHLVGYLVYWLSFFVIPDFPPLFLGSLFLRLDQVHANTERSMGRYDMVSVAHTQFLMAFCFEHFPSLAPSPADISGGALPTSFFSENDRIVDFQTEGITVSASALVAFAAARPCSLPALCAEGTRSMLYRPDSGFNVVVLPRNDRETFFSANDRLAWHRNLESLINYVHGVPEIPTLSDIYHRDVSLRSPKARQPGWRGKKSYWASSNTTPVASRGVTIAEPLSTVIPPRLTRAKVKEKMSSQQQGPQLKRLRKGAPTRAARTPRSEETPASVASVGEICFSLYFSLALSLLRHRFLTCPSLLRHEGKEHTPSSKLKRKREDEEAREGDSDSRIDDTALISRFFKLPRTIQASPGGMSVVVGKKVVVDLAEGESDGIDNDSAGGDGRNSEGVEGSDANSSSEGVEEDEEDDDTSGLISRRRIPTEGFLSIPEINQLAPEAVTPQLPRREEVKSAFDPFHMRVNVPPIDDLATHFQAHDEAVALTNLTSAEVFADLQDDSLISLGTSQTEVGTSHEQEAIEDDSDVRVVEPPVSNEEEVLSNEAFFGQFRLTRDEISFLSFVQDRFPYTFFKIRGLYSMTMGRMQLQCLHHFLLTIKDIRVCDLSLGQIEEIGHTVQNFDKLGFDIWWVYKELDAAKIMRGNEKLWRHCEGAKASLEEAQVALARARDVVAVAEAVVEERRLVYERMAEEAHLGDRLIDVPLCDTDPFLKKVFG